MPQLFERFYRVDKARSRALGGSGIGLTIAKAIVEAHDGRIWADSAGPGQGATFSLSLPIAADA
jgi:histidine kinase